jgi:hypothetical protein
MRMNERPVIDDDYFCRSTTITSAARRRLLLPVGVVLTARVTL